MKCLYFTLFKLFLLIFCIHIKLKYIWQKRMCIASRYQQSVVEVIILLLEAKWFSLSCVTLMLHLHTEYSSIQWPAKYKYNWFSSTILFCFLFWHNYVKSVGFMLKPLCYCTGTTYTNCWRLALAFSCHFFKQTIEWHSDWVGHWVYEASHGCCFLREMCLFVMNKENNKSWYSN